MARTVTADFWARQLIGQERGCAQCAHPGLRTGSYIGRTGPDCGGFGGSGGNSGAGVRFVSHLGRSRTIRLCGGAAAYGGPGTALWGLFWVFILVRPSVGFSLSPIHCGQGRVQHDLLIILLGLRPVRVFRSDTSSCRNAGERHDMAIDPEQTMRTLSLARW